MKYHATSRTLVAALLLSLMLAAVSRAAEIIEQVIVKVNGDILTKTDLETRQITALRQLGRLDQNSRPTDAQLRGMLDEVTPAVLVNFVDETLLVQRARELGLKLTDEQFKEAVDNIKKENKIESDEQFNAALKQEGMTLADLKVLMERQRLTFLVRQREVIDRLSVSDEETRRYYDAHAAEFTTEPSVALREILVAVPQTAEAAAKEKADEIRRRAASGEDFAKLAGEVSDAPSKANGGLIGPISLSDLAESVRKTIEPMQPGDVSDVVRTSTGFQIFKLETKTPKHTLPYDEARPQISERVFQQKQRVELQKYISKLRAEAIIDWKVADLKKAYDEGLKRDADGAEPIRSGNGD